MLKIIESLCLVLKLHNYEVLILSEILASVFKFFLIFKLTFNKQKSYYFQLPLILICIFLSLSLLDSAGNILMAFFYKIFKFDIEFKFITLMARLAMSTFLIRYFALSLFLKFLTKKKINFSKLDYIFGISSILVFICFSYLIIFKFNIPSHSLETLSFEKKLVQILTILLIIFFIPSINQVYKYIKNNNLPEILSKQLQIFIKFLIIPHLFLESIINRNSPLFFMTTMLPFNKPILYSLSTMLATYAMYYCTQKIFGLRFLNVKKHVETKHKFNFIDDFKNVLEQLGQVTAIKELTHVTQTFFKAAFSIPLGSTKLYVRKKVLKENDISTNDIILKISNKVENFIANLNDNPSLKAYLYKYKIFIKDEVEFSNFYEKTNEREQIIKFLNDVNADIFLPVFERQSISAYVIVEQKARPHELYNNVERDEMLVYASYISNIINILKNGNLDGLIKQQKEFSEELYNKHQEINQYKESIRTFLRMHQQRKFGIICHKGRNFAFINKEAQDLTGCIDLNIDEENYIIRDLKSLIKQVKQYKTTHSISSYDNQGNKLIITGMPNLENNMVIIMLYYPEVSDIVRSRFDSLKDPSKWDYLLYLETTKSGKLINDLIPGNSENLLNLKINLLNTALSKKATLLQIPEDDLMPTVEIIHYISLKESLQVLQINNYEQDDSAAIQLFGINPLLNYNNNQDALLYKLDSIGTLFIKNIHFLSMETQNKLAEYISYGYYTQLKSDQKIFTSVRIICSTDKKLSQLVTEGKFSKALFNELNKAYIKMPTIGTLPEEEINELTQGFTEQSLKTKVLKNILELNDREKNQIICQKPVSLKELKTRVRQLLIEKSNKNNITEKVELDPSFNIIDPDIYQAVRLGKNALKDSHIMSLLWNKFKNQNKIATLLGVNRSSVNRRCKEYNLT